MQDKGLYWKLGFIVLVILWAIVSIYPPAEKLKGGIDLVGGHTLLYEIDTTGLDNKAISGLSTRVMERLKVRVDPKSVMNLVWRPVGNTRLEIQMPLPRKDTIAKRKAFKKARDELSETNVDPSAVERALGSSNRFNAFEALAWGVAARRELLKDVAEAFDALQEAIAGKQGRDVIDDRDLRYDRQLAKLLATNVDLRSLGETLEIETGLEERKEKLNKIREEYLTDGSTQIAARLEAVITAYDAWSKVKGRLGDPDDLRRLLRGQGVLEFHILPTGEASAYEDYIRRLEQGKGERVLRGDDLAWFEIAKPESFASGFIVRQWNDKSWVLAYRTSDEVLDSSKQGWKLTRAQSSRDANGMPSVTFQFNEIGANFFARLTRRNKDKPLCIILDKKAYTAPTIRSQIRDRGEITGDFTLEETQYLASTLNAGSLDARLKENPISENSIGPSLGQDNRDAGRNAAIYGLIGVIVFMLVYYMWAGMIADIAVVMNLLILLAVMAAIEATFTMAGIAGIILTMGMAVDANVLIYERIREESEKVQSLRLIIKNGYERAMSTILDANITTLITCIVLYYIGTEEIKGFALTLGLGLVISMVTALVVTRVIFIVLIRWGVIKSLPMLRFFRRPKINWLGKQKYFWAGSAIMLVIGFVLFPLRGDDKYDIEFRGGTSIQVELKQPGLLDIGQMRDQVEIAGNKLRDSSGPIEQAILSSPEKDSYVLKFNDIRAERVGLALQSFMEDQLEKGSLQVRDANTLKFRVKDALKLTADDVDAYVKSAAKATDRAGKQLALAQVQSVGDENLRYEIVTVSTLQHLVIDAIIEVLGKDLKIQREIRYDLPIKDYPINRRRLGEVIKEPKVLTRVSDYRGGVAFVIDKLSPAVTIDQLDERIKAMRLQPDFRDLQWREFRIVGLTAAADVVAGESHDQIRYSRVAVMVADKNVPYEDDRGLWQDVLVDPELKLIKTALSKPGELQKVTQFAAQVASHAKTSAILALVLAFGAIILYLWVRFGTPRHGIAAVIALLHDVMICMAFVSLASLLADTPIGKALMLQDFKINLALVAAFMTVIGYSVNDTIVVYDRIRENRGKLTDITPDIVNDSFNQTLSRTVLTSLTTLMVMVILYIFGGDGVRGFAFVMIIGTLVGTYSSIAIASPLLLGWLGNLGRQDQGPRA